MLELLAVFLLLVMLIICGQKLYVHGQRNIINRLSAALDADERAGFTRWQDCLQFHETWVEITNQYPPDVKPWNHKV